MTAIDIVKYYNEKRKAGFTDTQIAEQLGLNVGFLQCYVKSVKDIIIILIIIIVIIIIYMN